MCYPLHKLAELVTALVEAVVDDIRLVLGLEVELTALELTAEAVVSLKECLLAWGREVNR